MNFYAKLAALQKVAPVDYYAQQAPPDRVDPEQARALVRWNLRHGNEASTGRAMDMVASDPDADAAATRARAIAQGLGSTRSRTQ